MMTKVNFCTLTVNIPMCVFISVFPFIPTGSMIERITVFCSSAQELQEWLESLQPFTKGGSPAGTISKVLADSHKYTHGLTLSQ